jgi:dephospho-CoA kinase
MNILLYTGFSASGKSTIAKETNLDLGYSWLDERGILHKRAHALGYPRIRNWLAEVGPEAIIQAARMDTVTIIEEIRAQQNPIGIILDGVYDRELPTHLKAAFPDINQLLIAVYIEQNLRARRLGRRIENDSADVIKRELELVDGFKKFAGVEDLVAQADIKIENAGSLEESVVALKEKLREHGINVPNKERA